MSCISKKFNIYKIPDLKFYLRRDRATPLGIMHSFVLFGYDLKGLGYHISLFHFRVATVYPRFYSRSILSTSRFYPPPILSKFDFIHFFLLEILNKKLLKVIKMCQKLLFSLQSSLLSKLG